MADNEEVIVKIKTTPYTFDGTNWSVDVIVARVMTGKRKSVYLHFDSEWHAKQAKLGDRV